MRSMTRCATEDGCPTQVEGGDDEDLRAQQLVVDGGPVVAGPHVGLHPGQEVEVDRADRLHLDATPAQLGADDVGQRLGVRRRGRRFQRAVDDASSHG